MTVRFRLRHYEGTYVVGRDTTIRMFALVFERPCSSALAFGVLDSQKVDAWRDPKSSGYRERER